MTFNKSKLALAVAATAGLTFSSGAFATNGIIQAGNGMAAHGLGGAGLSNANEAMSGFDNPALIGQTGDSVSMGFSIFMPDRQVDATTSFGAAAPVVSDNNVFAIPQVAFTSKINDGMSWGIMVNALGGMNTDYRTGPSGTGAPQTVDLSGMIIAPTMSFALGKNASLGASLIIGYENLRVRNLFGAGVTNEGSSMAYGVKLGADFKVTDGISVGAVLQPKLVSDELSFFKDFLSGMGFNGDAALVLPNTAGVGAKFAAGKNMDIVADILYYQWSGVDVFEFFGWEDQIVYKAGVEFRPSDKLALRAGFNYGESPIQGGNRTGNGGGDAAFANYPFPAISESHFTIGLGYKMDKNMAINAYYLYSPEACQTATTSSAGMTGGPTAIGTEICMTQNAFGFGFNYAAK
jgi:long-chain fatty acid transport protein